jgi:RNA polymerase sigma factor (sigma-70 family)
VEEIALQAPEPADLQALLDRIREGDDQALASLLQRYETQLRVAGRVLLGARLRSQVDSLDLVQSVHRVLMPGLREGRYRIASLDQLLALARTIIRHKVIRNWRRMQREDATQASRLEQSSADASAASSAGDTSKAIEIEDLKRHILGGLNDFDRRVIELRLDGFSNVEIADMLGCDAHALRAHLSRLRQQLRRDGLAEWL